jgi:hypothetical protein
MRAVLDVEYSGIGVEGVREVVVVTHVTYGMSLDGSADTHCCCCCVCSVLCDRGVGRGVRCEDIVL